MVKMYFWNRARVLQIINKYIGTPTSLTIEKEHHISYDIVYKIVQNELKEAECVNAPSVDNIPTYRISETNSYQLLRNVSLMEHIDNVLKEIQEAKIEEADRDILALYGLLHDIGKCKKLREKYNVDNRHGHENSSAQLIRAFLHTYSELKPFAKILEKIANELQEHRKKAAGYYYKLLQECDARAREKELLKLRK